MAKEKGSAGLYTQGKDNKPGACLFYWHTGFNMGGIDTKVYRHTKQAGKAILFSIVKLSKYSKKTEISC